MLKFLEKYRKRRDNKALEEDLLKLMAPVYNKYDVLMQPWQDGWLFHLYKKGGEHITTIGSYDLQTCIEKCLLFNPKEHVKNK